MHIKLQVATSNVLLTIRLALCRCPGVGMGGSTAHSYRASCVVGTGDV